MLTLPAAVTVVEVGPRDGLQALPQVYPTELKIELIDRLADTGLRCIEAVSFVHPRVVPQLADAEQVMAGIRRRPGVVYRGLVPNRRGAERAAAAGVDEIVALLTVSETYCRKNQNMSVDENLAALADVYEVAAAAGIPVVTVVATAFFCPYEGLTPEERVLAVLRRAVDLGARRLVLATTTGMADPAHVHRLFRRVREAWPDVVLGVHLHNTNGMALANALAALDAGATLVEGAICGLGGGIRMPKDLDVGNVPTEDLVHMLNLMGVATGVDLDRLLEVCAFAAERLGITPKSFVMRHGTREQVLARTRAGGGDR